ncbi:MAG: putative porin [Bacteroidales bacterium]
MNKNIFFLLLFCFALSDLVFSQSEDTITIKHVEAYEWNFKNYLIHPDSLRYDFDTVPFFHFYPYKDYKYNLTNDLVGGIVYPARIPDLIKHQKISNIRLPYLKFVGFFDPIDIPLIKSDTAIMQARFMQGIKREEFFQTHFTMPILDFANFNFFYRTFYAPSTYANSMVRQNQFYINFFGNTKNKKYDYYLGLIQQNRTTKENGGIKNMSSFVDSAKTDRILLNIYLPEASAYHKINDYYYSHSYKINKFIELFHYISYSQYSYRYTDNKPSEDFYYLYDGLQNDSIFDSLNVWLLDNIVGVKANTKNWDFNINYNYSFGKFKMNLLKSKPIFTFINADINFKKFVNISMQYYWGDYRDQKVYISGHFPSFSYGIGYNKFSQPYIYSHFLGKYYRYDKLLPETEIIWANLKNKNKFGNVALCGGYVKKQLFFDKYGFIRSSDPYLFATLEFDLRFDFGKHFVLQTYHLFQYPYNKKTISVPVWLTRNVFYYHTPLFKGNAHLKTGIEFLYLTKYYAPAWNPNIQYFVVSENKLGNFIYPSLNIQLKVKKAIIFVQLENFTDGVFKTRQYMTIAGHPMRDMTFRWGLQWNFYN